GGAGSDGHHRRRRHHGAAAQDAAAARRAVPSREHRLGERARAAAELPRYRSRLPPEESCLMDIKGALARIGAGKDLTGEEMRAVMNIVMSGEATPAQTGAFLMGMRVKGETVGEIAAAVSILREKMVPVEAPEDVIDIVGTGGDGAET